MIFKNVNEKKEQIHSLVECFLSEQEESFSEYELLTYLNKSNVFESLILSKEENLNLTLFYKHFLIMNALYTLQDLLWENDKIILTVSPLKIEKRSADSKILANDNMSLSKVGQGVIDPVLKEYYLNFDNVFSQSNESIGDLLSNFWMMFSRSPSVDGIVTSDNVRLSTEYIEKCRVLDIDPASTLVNIRKKYRIKIIASHPDRGGKAEDFIAVREAYEYLKIHCTN